MKARWLELAAKYAALSLRERAMVAVAAVGLVVYLGNTLFLTPIYGRAASFSRQSLLQAKELARLQEQVQMLRTEAVADPNAPIRSALSEVKSLTSTVDQSLLDFERSLVPPKKMAEVLDSLLRERRGIRVLSLKTLPVEPLLATKSETGAEEGAKPTTTSLNMYRHGFELKLEGAYLDLVAGLAELEKNPQQLLWQRISMTVTEEQKTILTLRFFSLSLDKAWISL